MELTFAIAPRQPWGASRAGAFPSRANTVRVNTVRVNAVRLNTIHLITFTSRIRPTPSIPVKPPTRLVSYTQKALRGGFPGDGFGIWGRF